MKTRFPRDTQFEYFILKENTYGIGIDLFSAKVGRTWAENNLTYGIIFNWLKNQFLNLFRK